MAIEGGEFQRAPVRNSASVIRRVRSVYPEAHRVRPIPCLVLLTLLAVDAFVLALNAWMVLTDQPPGPLSMISQGWAVALYQHVKELAIISLLAAVATRRRESAYIFWVGVFLYFFVDDLFGLRQTLGGVLGDAAGVRTRAGYDMTEVALLASLALLAGFLLLLTYRRGSAQFKADSRILLLLVLVLAAFAIGVDGLQVVLQPGDRLLALLKAVEVGGELLILSITVSACLVMFYRHGNPPDRTPAS